MGAHAVPERAARAVGIVPVPRGAATGRRRRAEHDAALGPGGALVWRHASCSRAPVEVDWIEDAPQDARRYVAGERVRHRKFGSGVVRAVSGSGRDLKVMVEFDDQEIGTKQLLVAYAGLEREWESA